MNNNRLGLYGLFVKVDLETQSWKGLAGPCDGFAISEQTQHAQIELSVDGFALALGIAPFEGGLAAFYAHPVIQRGLAGRQACQTERGRALHACLAIRSEEHTSELQSLMRISYAVFCLKKKKHTTR